ncbi:MAG: 2-phosphosulfolactate phosphatase [candidate division KSB1 bacterium]|nr:2-phosphosulfolactate phosphatase [candidate division KSB1 bacterium]
MKLDVCLVPGELSNCPVAQRAVVVIDVLRASTTMITAFAHGCRALIPVEEVEEAKRIAATIGDEHVLLGGERGGLRIEGFTLGNSPREYRAATVRESTIVFSSTNGSRLFRLVQNGAAVFVGALVNVGAVAKALAEEGRDVLLVCAGREGRFSAEDCFCAGMIIDRLRKLLPRQVELSDAAQAALRFFAGRRRPLRVLQKSEHGRFLTTLGLQQDLAVCAEVDAYDVVPVYAEGVIRAGRR